MKFNGEVLASLEFDRSHIWHPYTSMLNPMTVYPVKEASGCEIVLDTEDPKDHKMIDAMSSWWCAIHGYNNQELNDALITQMQKVSHVMFGGLTHASAISLVQKLLKLLNHDNLQHCFLADSGSVAMEIALKMALQYQFTLNPGSESIKKKFLTISNGYHGDTTGAMSVCDPLNSMHSIYKGYLAENIFVSAPSTIPTLPTSRIYMNHPEAFEGQVVWKEQDFKDFQEKMQSMHHEICAVVLEPILQGAGGMRFYHPQFLIEVRKMCNLYGIPLIMDEIATGFGRTGTMFAFQHCKAYQDQCHIPENMQIDVYPDIICVGKALTGGYLTLSAVVTTPNIALTISDPKSATGGCLMHGPTFMGNPLACAVANSSLDIMIRGDWKRQVEFIEEQLFQGLFQKLMKKNQPISPIIADVRVAGAVAIIELKDPVDGSWFHEKFVSKGVYVRPFRNLCYIMPPYIITPEQIGKVIRVIHEVLVEWEQSEIRLRRGHCN